MSRPNILYIHSHDTGRYIQPYGAPVATPHLQKLAEEGVLFRQAFSCGPTCSPSRAALLTGQAPHTCGMFGLVNRGFELRDREKHLARFLSDRGYLTAVIGVNHEAKETATLGYMVNQGNWRRGEEVSKQASEFLGSAPSEPFFLSVGFFETHRPFRAEDEADDPRYCRPPAPLPDTPEVRKDVAELHGSVKKLDRAMGAVLTALEKAGLKENTLVICTTDHGPPFPYMKCHLTDLGTGVTLIVRGPGGFTGGKVFESLVSHIDLFPTICGLADLEPPDWLQGRSMLPLVSGQRDEINEAVYSEINYHTAYEPVRSIRTKRFRYVRRFSDYPHPIMAQEGGASVKDLLFEAGYADETLPREELFDLILDPLERRSCAERLQNRETLDALRGRLDLWMRETGDPLLSGPVPAPETAVISDDTDYDGTDVVGRRKRQATS